MYLLALDSTGTQPYIFGSNRLRHNIGASHLVARATGQWALEAVQKAASPQRTATSPQRTNVKDAAALELQDSDDPAYWIEENPDLAAEVLYAGGGNVVVLFREKDVANDFRRHLSEWLVERAPELELAESGEPFEWREEEWNSGSESISLSALSGKLDAVLRALGRKKDARRTPPRPVNHSVTQPGQIHGQPAVAMQDPPGPGEDPYPISSEAEAKEEHLHRANQRLENLLPPPNGYAYPFELGKLGQAKGEQSFIAVVHADGDRMGNLLQEVARNHQSEETGDRNRSFIQRMRAFSEVVRGAALDALKDMIGGLHTFIEEHPDGDCEVELPYLDAPLRLDRRDGRLLLPLRPIVFGGDDVTFVCDGRLGLALTARYVRCFETRFDARVKESDVLPPLSGKTTASAGVSIVKTHYPFSRAYGLAEELTRSAKDQRQGDSAVGSYMDWHVALDDLPGSLEAVRKQYQLSGQTGSRYSLEQTLTVRPVAVTGGKKWAENRWEKIRSHIQDFRNTDHARNVVKELREKLRQGPAAVKAFVEEHDLQDLIDGTPDGFKNGKTPYLDVLELMDLAVVDGELESCDDANGKNN